MFLEKDSLPWHVVGLLVVVHVSLLEIVGAAPDISEKLYELWNVTYLLFSDMSKLSMMKTSKDGAYQRVSDKERRCNTIGN